MTKEDSNAHRKDKVHFSVYLTPSEAVQVDQAQKDIEAGDRKELLLRLCKAVEEGLV